MLYAQINRETNQMIGSPVELPSNFVVGGGIVVSGFNLMSQKMLAVFGWVPVYEADNPDPLSYYISKVPTYQEDSESFILQAVPRELTPLVEEAQVKIDNAASNVCVKYMTVGAGQEMRYLMKAAQADAAIALQREGGSPKLIDYPMVALEAQACDMDFWDKALEIVNTRNAWVQLAANIEATRVGGKQSCREATTPKDLFIARDTAIAILEAL